MKIRTMRNALVPVNKMPVEILQQIPSWLPYVSEVVAASHVCRYWRAAFLSCSNLWTFIDCKSIPATRAYVERSGVSPLQICILPGYSYNAFVYTIPHVQRWGSFSATVGGEEIDPVLAVLSGPSSAPKLHNLSVVPMVGYAEGGTVTSKGKILGGLIPSLERLTLCNLRIEIHKLTAPNLTYLFLASPSPEFISMTAVLDFLKRSPLLEEVELRYPGPKIMDIAHPDHTVILNHLRRIVLWDRGSIYLNHLMLPKGIECELNYVFGDGLDKKEFLKEIFGTLPAGLKPIFNAESLSIVPHCTHGSVRFLGPYGLVEIYPSFHHSECPSPTSFLAHPRSALKKVRELFVGSRNEVIPEWESTDIRKYLKRMPSLETLIVMHSEYASFVRALLPVEGKVPCPTLKNLNIYVGPTESFCIHVFREMIEQRESSGHRFKKILLVLSYDLRIQPPISNLEVRVDDRPLYWDSKKKIWRYLKQGEIYWEGNRSLAPPGIISMDPLFPPMPFDFDL